eukprot:scaffold3202_cov117-Isochrysis_galbana.AAC.3
MRPNRHTHLRRACADRNRRHPESIAGQPPAGTRRSACARDPRPLPTALSRRARRRPVTGKRHKTFSAAEPESGGELRDEAVRQWKGEAGAVEATCAQVRHDPRLGFDLGAVVSVADLEHRHAPVGGLNAVIRARVSAEKAFMRAERQLQSPLFAETADLLHVMREGCHFGLHREDPVQFKPAVGGRGSRRSRLLHMNNM